MYSVWLSSPLKLIGQGTVLGKNVSNLITSWNVVDAEIFVKNMISDEVKI